MAANPQHVYVTIYFMESGDISISVVESTNKIAKFVPYEVMRNYLSTGAKTVEFFNGETNIAYSNISDLTQILTTNMTLTKLSLIADVPLDDKAKAKAVVSVVKALHDKPRLVDVSIRGYLPHNVYTMLATLPLESLTVSNTSSRFRGLDLIHGIKTLRRLIIDLPYLPPEDRMEFLIPMMGQVEILNIDSNLTSSELDIIGDNLATNTSLRKLIIRIMDQDLTSIGNALRMNTALRMLQINGGESDLSPIFDGMADNNTIIKLAIAVDLGGRYMYMPDDQTYVPALINMLRRNTYLENLHLYIDIMPEDMSALAEPIAQSSLIKLALNYDESRDMSRFIEKLLTDLRSNTTMRELMISVGPDDDSYLEASVLVNLLTRNTTLEVLLLDMVLVQNPEQLSALIHNITLVQVTSNMPKILKTIAERNKANRDVRNVSLFKLVS